MKSGSPQRSGRSVKRVALTYDDGPSERTAELVQLLSEEGAAATFFVLVQNCLRRPKVLRSIATNPKMELANHSWSHPNLTALDDEQLHYEVAKSKTEIEQISGRSISLFRPPEGQHDARTKQAAADSGQAIIMWSLNSMDWKKERRPHAAATVVRSCRDGDIVLLHDWDVSDPDATRTIVRQLKSKGFEFVTVGALLGDVTPGSIERGGVGQGTLLLRRIKGRVDYSYRWVVARLGKARRD